MHQSMSIRKPNLFIVGYPKAGTTALSQYLNKHKDIYMPSVKEPHYFAKELLIKRYTSNPKLLKHKLFNEKRYLEYYKNKNEKFLLDATHNYIVSKKAPKEIYNFNREAKVIIILREPIDWLRSLHNAMLYGMVESETSFEKAIEREIYNQNDDGYIFTQYLKAAEYTAHIISYIDTFPYENVKILIYKNLRKENLKVVNEVLSWLNLEEFDALTLNEVNSFPKLRYKSLRKIGENPYIFVNLKRVVPEKLFVFIRDIFVRLTTYKGTKSELTPEKEIQLKAKLINEIRNLETLLKKKGFIESNFDLLDFWGYK